MSGLVPTISLVAVFALFLAIVAWVFLVVPKSKWQRDARIPLERTDRDE